MKTTFVRPDHRDDRVRRATDGSCLGEFPDRTPPGVETPVVDRRRAPRPDDAGAGPVAAAAAATDGEAPPAGSAALASPGDGRPARAPDGSAPPASAGPGPRRKAPAAAGTGGMTADGGGLARGAAGGRVRLGPAAARDPLAYDLVIYGGTLSGIMAARRATRRGLRVCVVEPTAHLGGVPAGGLAVIDRPICHHVDVAYLVAGETRQFFVDLNVEYGGDAATPLWYVEPKVTERMAIRWLLETGATVVLNSRLHGPGQLHVLGRRIRAMSTAMGWVRGRYWIDASYEMDMARFAGAPYRVGRESQAAFGEVRAGFKPRQAYKDTSGPFTFSSDTPYPLVPRPTGLRSGAGDDAIQTYSFRHVLCNQQGNTIPFERPSGYSSATYELLRQVIVNWRMTSAWEVISGAPLPQTVRKGGRSKRCINNAKLISIELNGRNHAYPLATQSWRDAYTAEHAAWQQGLYWFLQNDPACPEPVRASFANWGLPADEFPDSPHGRGFGHHIYIREACRLNGRALLRQQDVCGHQGGEVTRATSILGWAYYLDCHPVRVYREGDSLRGEGPTGARFRNVPYEIPAECLMPATGPENLLVSVAISATHVAWMPTRMEPVFMMCGEAAGEIAAQCVAAGNIAVADYSYPRLAAALVERGSNLKVRAWSPREPGRKAAREGRAVADGGVARSPEGAAAAGGEQPAA